MTSHCTAVRFCKCLRDLPAVILSVVLKAPNHCHPILRGTNHSRFSLTGNYVEMARYHLVFAVWKELRENTKKPEPIEQLDIDEAVDLNNIIESFEINGNLVS